MMAHYTARGIIINVFYDFVIGFIAFLTYIKHINFVRGTFVLILLGLFVMFYVSYISGLVPLVTALIILFYRSDLKLQPLYFIGNISYSLYLIHVPVSAFLIDKVGQIVSNKAVLLMLSLIFSIGIAYIFYIIIERTSLNVSKRFSIKKKS